MGRGIKVFSSLQETDFFYKKKIDSLVELRLNLVNAPHTPKMGKNLFYVENESFLFLIFRKKAFI